MDHDSALSPCFSPAAAALRLPVAPRANALCKYRDDCAGSPGCQSPDAMVLTPGQALAFVRDVRAARPDLAMVGVAGPGEPLATPAETLAALRLVREACPELKPCLSTNGLHLASHLDDLLRLGVSHVTITASAVDPAVAARLHAWVRPGARNLRLLEGATALVDEQRQAVRALKAKGVRTRIHALLVPGVNDDHMEDLARTMASLGADAMHVAPGRPIPDFAADLPDRPVPADVLERVRRAAARHLPLSPRCLACQGRQAEDPVLAEALRRAAALPPGGAAAPDPAARPYLAVASADAERVDLHLGEVASFLIIGKTDGRLVLKDRRDAPEPGGGPARWERLAAILADCRAVLVSGAGQAPIQILAKAGLPVKIITGPFALEASAILD